MHLHPKNFFFNSVNFLTFADTEKGTLHIPSTYRKHIVKICPFQNILRQHRFQFPFKIKIFYDYLYIFPTTSQRIDASDQNFDKI